MALKSTKFIIVSEFTYFDYILYIWDVEELSLLPLLESDRKYISFFCELTRSFVQGTKQIISLC